MLKSMAILIVILLATNYGWQKYNNYRTQQLLELSRIDPIAFNKFVQAQINAAAPSMISQNASKAVQIRKPMTIDELAELSKSDPNAMQKYLNSHVQDGDNEPNAAEKLLNFLAHGKYE